MCAVCVPRTKFFVLAIGAYFVQNVYRVGGPRHNTHVYGWARQQWDHNLMMSGVGFLAAMDVGGINPSDGRQLEAVFAESRLLTPFLSVVNMAYVFDAAPMWMPTLPQLLDQRHDAPMMELYKLPTITNGSTLA